MAGVGQTCGRCRVRVGSRGPLATPQFIASYFAGDTTDAVSIDIAPDNGGIVGGAWKSSHCTIELSAPYTDIGVSCALRKTRDLPCTARKRVSLGCGGWNAGRTATCADRADYL